ncbi:GTP-binding protein OBGC, chloroplastic [Tanacetum coccineum]
MYSILPTSAFSICRIPIIVGLIHDWDYNVTQVILSTDPQDCLDQNILGANYPIRVDTASHPFSTFNDVRLGEPSDAQHVDTHPTDEHFLLMFLSIHIIISQVGLSGHIPVESGFLQKLRHLDVGDNHLVGTIRELIRIEGCFPALRNLAKREKFVLLGGPSGGDGGRGGNVYLHVDGAMNSLLPFRNSIHFRAGRGSHGQWSKMNRAKGEDRWLRFCPGRLLERLGKTGCW